MFGPRREMSMDRADLYICSLFSEFGSLWFRCIVFQKNIMSF